MDLMLEHGIIWRLYFIILDAASCHLTCGLEVGSPHQLELQLNTPMSHSDHHHQQPNQNIIQVYTYLLNLKGFLSSENATFMLQGRL